MDTVMDVMKIVDELLEVPLATREQVGFDKYMDFVRRYPKLFRVLSTTDDFDRAMLEKFVALSRQSDLDKATETVTNDLQNRYVVPVLNRLNKE